MPRAPFQILVIPYRRLNDGDFEFAVLQRSDDSAWQFIAGGGDEGETPQEAAVREAFEEAMVPADSEWIRLDAIASIPRTAFPGGAHWPDDLHVVPEHCFAVDVSGVELAISGEHAELEWLGYEQAYRRLRWQSNQVALWELNQRLLHGKS